MGFKDLECFNQAFLAKQRWKILKHPNILVSRILNVSYLMDKIFVEAKCDSTDDVSVAYLRLTNDE